MTRAEFLKVMGWGAAALAVESIPGKAMAAEVIAPSGVSSEPAPLPKNTERLSFGLPDQEAHLLRPIRLIVIGAGARGNVYASYSKHYPNSMQVVGVSDINDVRKRKMQADYGIAEEHCFGDWSEVFRVPKFADAVIISTPDDVHYKPCMKALEMGYDVLLEKPIAQTARECTDILQQARKYGRIVGICHVLRYAPYFRALKRVVNEGMVGDIISMTHLEPVRFHHMAHSYVRGNWHSAKQTTPIIVAKSCHDLDIIRWLIGKRCQAVEAFGDLSFFIRKNEPVGAADRCLDCAIENQCAFSALKIYEREHRYLYVFDNLPERGAARDSKIHEYLRTTDYGKCVFRCQNDQCDHFVSNLRFEGGATASLQVEALTSYGGRKTRIMGTKGDVVGDMKSFTVTDFLTGKHYLWDEDISKLPGYEGHGGGDWGVVKDFLDAVGHQDERYLSSTIDVSVESHVMGFRAEESRVNNKVIRL